jgi:hypothetical protein
MASLEIDSHQNITLFGISGNFGTLKTSNNDNKKPARPRMGVLGGPDASADIGHAVAVMERRGFFSCLRGLLLPLQTS